MAEKPLEELDKVKVTGLLGNEEVRALAEVLPRMKKLRKLTLESVFLRNGGSRELNKSLSTIIGALATSRRRTQLEVLKVGENRIDCEGARIISRVLRWQTIQYLDLQHNNIWQTGATYLADAIQNNHSLKKLRLGGNSIRDAGAKKIAAALECNNTLVELDISNNYIFDDGAESIASALTVNRTLKILSIQGNQTGLRTKHAFMKTLRENSTLKQVDFEEFDFLKKKSGEGDGTSERVTEDAEELEMTIEMVLKESQKRNVLQAQVQALRDIEKCANADASSTKFATLKQVSTEYLVTATEKVRERQDELSRVLEKLKEENQDLLLKINHSKQRIEENERTLEESALTRQNLEETRASCEKSIGKLRIHIQQLEEVNASLKSRLLDKVNEEVKTAGYVSKTKNEIERLKASVAQAKLSSATTREKTSKLSVEVEKMMADLAQFDKTQLDVNARLGCLQQEEIELVQQLAHIRTDVAARAGKLEKLEVDHNKMLEKYRTVEHSREEIQKKLKEQYMKVYSLRSELNNEQDDEQAIVVNLLQKTLHEVTAERDNLQSKVKSLEDILRSFEAKNHQAANESTQEIERKLLYVTAERDLYKTQVTNLQNSNNESQKRILELEVSKKEIERIQTEKEEELQRMIELAQHQRQPNNSQFESLLISNRELLEKVAALEQKNRDIATPLASQKSIPKLSLSSIGHTELEVTAGVESESKLNSPRPLNTHKTKMDMLPECEVPPPVPEKGRALAYTQNDHVPSSQNPSNQSQTENTFPSKSRMKCLERNQSHALLQEEANTGTKSKDEVPESTSHVHEHDARSSDYSQLLQNGGRFMRKGIVSVSGFQPRYVWFSENLKLLYWAKGPAKSVKHKSVPFWTVTSIEFPDFSEQSTGQKKTWSGWTKSNSNKKKIFRFFNRDGRDAFDLSCENVDQSQNWAKALQWLLDERSKAKQDTVENPRSGTEEESIRGNSCSPRESLGSNQDQTTHNHFDSRKTRSQSLEELRGPTFVSPAFLNELSHAIDEEIKDSGEDEHATYKTIRESVCRKLGMNLSSNEWKEWFHAQIDKILRDQDDEEDELDASSSRIDSENEATLTSDRDGQLGGSTFSNEQNRSRSRSTRSIFRSRSPRSEASSHSRLQRSTSRSISRSPRKSACEDDYSGFESSPRSNGTYGRSEIDNSPRERRSIASPGSDRSFQRFEDDQSTSSKRRSFGRGGEDSKFDDNLTDSEDELSVQEYV